MLQGSNGKICQLTKTLLCDSVRYEYETQDYLFRQALLPHIDAYYKHAAEMGIMDDNDDVECEKFGLVYYECGYWRRAEELYSKGLEMRKKKFGTGHASILTSMGNLASTFSNQGRWKEAEELDVQVMDTSKRVQ